MNKNLFNKWKAIPGVVYTSPEVVLPEGYNPKTKAPYDVAPKGYISTREAAQILRAGDSAARVKLKKHKIKFIMVKLEGICPRHFWKKADVEQLADKAPPFASAETVRNLISLAELCQIANVGRSTVLRAMDKGLINAIAYRVLTGQGRQKRLYFTKEEAQKYVAHLKKSSRVGKVKKFLGLE